MNLDTIFPGSVMAPPDTCIVPVITDVTVLQFATYAEAQVTVFPSTIASTIYFRETGATGEFTVAPDSETGVFMVAALGKNKTYEVAVQNRCGVTTVIGIIDTKTAFEGTVTVSENLHYELNRYLKEESDIKLTDFLRNLTSISLFERASFVQRFFFKGAPLLDGVPPEIPKIIVPTLCFCNSIITTQLAIPATLQFLTLGSGNVEVHTQPSSSGNTNGNNLGHNARTWKWMDNKGAGKYHQLWTEGFKANKSQDHVNRLGWDDGVNNIASQKSYIRATLLCLDGDEVPAECGCEKDIEFGFRYDTRVTAHAHLVGTTNARNSWAQVEDMYTAIFEDESKPLNSRYEVIRMGMTRAATECNWTVNPAFWTNIATLLGDAAELYVAYSATQNSSNGQQPNPAQQVALVNAITSFATTLGSVFTTPYGQSTACNNDDDKFGGEEVKSIQKALKPNATVTFTLSSFNRIACGGKRKWHSWGRVLSGHYLTGVIKHNAFDGTPAHCCTPKVGMWMVGHCGGSATEAQLKVQAADLLYHNGIVNLLSTPSGNMVVNDFGYTIQASSLEICNQIVVNPTVTGGRSDGYEPFIGEADNAYIQIFDFSGRLVKNLQWTGQFVSSDVSALKIANANLLPGLYLILASNKDRKEIYKFFIH